jgi:hypothetical protein
VIEAKDRRSEIEANSRIDPGLRHSRLAARRDEPV